MIRRVWLLLVLTTTARAAAPEWASAAANEEVPVELGFGLVAYNVRATYLTPYRVRRVYRYAVKLEAENSRGAIKPEWPFNSDSDRIVAARAWVLDRLGNVRTFRRDDFLDVSYANKLFWNSQRTLTFDGSRLIEVGGTLACEVEIETQAVESEIFLRFAPGFYTARTVFEVIPPEGFHLQWNASSKTLPQPIPTDGTAGLRWACGPRRPDRGTVPAGFLPNDQRVSVRAVAAVQGPTWADLAKLLFGIMQPRTETSDPVRALAVHLTAARIGRWERIRALTEFVQHDIAYLNISTVRDILAGVRPHAAEEVLRSRYGDCKDKAALLLALLRAVGEDGRILVVNNGAPQMIDERWPSLLFNHVIVGIRAGPDAPANWTRLDGKELGPLVLFDPTDSTTPLGLLSPGDQGGNSLLVDAGHGGLVRLPQTDGASDRVERTIESRLAENGVLTVAAEVDLQGLPAAELHGQRVAVRAERMTEFLTRTLDASAPAIRGFSWKEQWDEPKAGYRLNFQFQAAGFSRWLTDDLLAVNPQLFPVGALPAWKTSAEGVAQLQNRVMVDHTRIALPAGYRLEELPPNWDKQGAAVSCHLHYAVKAGVLECDSEFSVRPGFYERERYEAIRLFILKFREAQRRPVLLRPLKPGSPAPAASPPAPA